MTGSEKGQRRKRTGSSRIFGVFKENESVIKKFLRRYTSSAHEIEDITQETILRALQAEKTKEIHEPRAFLFGIAKNVVRKQLDKRSNSIIDFVEDFSGKEYISNEPAIDDSVDSRQRMLIFWEAVSTLPEQCQRVFVLKKVYGYSHKEISRKLSISTSTAEKHVAAGLKRCSEYMERELSDDIKSVESKAKSKKGR